MGNQTTKAKISAERRMYWSSVISEWEKSNLTKHNFCILKKITPSVFYLWYKRIRNPGNRKPNSKQKKETAKSAKTALQSPKAAHFIPLDLKSAQLKHTQAKSSCFSVRLPNGIEIKIENPSAMSLVDCVKALKEI